jgi:hypothetical protein
MIREGGGKGIKIIKRFQIRFEKIKLEIENTLNKTTPLTSNLVTTYL